MNIKQDELRVAILGKEGSGKTTLAAVMVHLLRAVGYNINIIGDASISQYVKEVEQGSSVLCNKKVASQTIDVFSALSTEKIDFIQGTIDAPDSLFDCTEDCLYSPAN
jgi:ABC-type cobalamin/Fe3+-siderophores transport system ATPase subunit